MRRFLSVAVVIVLAVLPVNAVLKEKDLGNTLSILRDELTSSYQELERQSGLMKEQQENVKKDLVTVLAKSSQNSLMLYSQKPDYIFDLTYACHEATEQYARFQQTVLPFRSFIRRIDNEIARYDSLMVHLSSMPTMMLTEREKIDRSVCLTLVVSIRRTLKENSEQLNDYIRYYKMTEERLRSLNDYANKRYADIQTSIFKNGGESYFSILASLRTEYRTTKDAVTGKYRSAKKLNSQWDSRVIVLLFFIIIVCGLISYSLNAVAVRYIRKQRWSPAWLDEKSQCVVLTATVVTMAILLGIIRWIYKDQNFIIMASDLLVEYIWLLGVILISLLLRLNMTQIKSGFRIYSPLILIGLIVIVFRIVLIPNDLVNLIFPPILLLCSYWQWKAMKKHNRIVPSSDRFFTYMSEAVLLFSLAFSWIGYTLLSVQVLIWWIMQLTCVLTITCFKGLLQSWAASNGMDDQPITEAWLYRLICKVVVPAMAVYSLLISIYWAADIFNLSSTTKAIFTNRFIDTGTIAISIHALALVVTLFFLFSYINATVKELLRLYFEKSDKSTAETRSVMMKNVVQVAVWGMWIIISLSILHVSNTWLVVISGGLSTGIGFASKDILENIYYGISLMTGRVKVGDYIECDGTRGRVSSISYTSTMVDTVDGSVIAFQNSQLFTKNYKNMTKNHGLELDTLEVGVAYGTDIAKVRQLLTEAIVKLDCVMRKSDTKILLKGFGDNSIDLKILVWVSVRTHAKANSDVLECVYNTLNENNIEIPFPQRDVRILEHQG